MSAESRCVEDNVSIGLLKLSCTMEEEEEEAYHISSKSDELRLIYSNGPF